MTEPFLSITAERKPHPVIEKWPMIIKAIWQGIKDEAETAMKERAPYDTGRLRGSIHSTMTPGKIQIIAGGKSTLGPNVKYAYFANLRAKFKTSAQWVGRRPNRPVKHAPGPRYLERTEQYLRPVLPKLVDAVVKSFNKGVGSG